jgi:hypothetical protein
MIRTIWFAEILMMLPVTLGDAARSGVMCGNRCGNATSPHGMTRRFAMQSRLARRRRPTLHA